MNEKVEKGGLIYFWQPCSAGVLNCLWELHSPCPLKQWRHNQTSGEWVLKKRIRALRGSKLLIILKSHKRWFIFVETYQFNMLRSDKIWGQSYTQVLKVSMPSTSLSNTERDIAVAARNSRPLLISMDLGLLYVGCKLVSIQPHSYSRQIIH